MLKLGKSLLCGYVLVLHGVLAVVLCKSDFCDRAAVALGVYRASDDYAEGLERTRSLDRACPEGAVVFLGDSRVKHMYVPAVTQKGVNLGIVADTCSGLLERVDEYQSVRVADAVVVAIGVNDVRHRSPEEIAADCARIVGKVPESVAVVVSAILPIDERVLSKPGLTNSQIRAVNRRLAELCLTRPRCRYEDSFDRLVDETGNLPPGCHVGDGIHLSAQGYQRWIPSLQEALRGLAVTKVGERARASE